LQWKKTIEAPDPPDRLVEELSLDDAPMINERRAAA